MIEKVSLCTRGISYTDYHRVYFGAELSYFRGVRGTLTNDADNGLLLEQILYRYSFAFFSLNIRVKLGTLNRVNNVKNTFF